MIGLLVAIIVVLIVLVVAKYVIDWMELERPFRQIALLIVGLVCLLILLGQFGFLGPRLW